MHQGFDSVSCKLCCFEGDAIWLVKYEDGLYGLPGGRMSKGESIGETLKREAVEELGVGVKEAKIVDAWASLNDPGRDNEDCMVLLFESVLESRPSGVQGTEGELPVLVKISEVDSLKMRQVYKNSLKKIYESAKRLGNTTY